MTRFNKWNKYSARKTESKLCGRIFDSKGEARRGEDLHILQKAGEIKNLEYQVTYQLCEKPNIKIRLDFRYRENGKTVVEDVKGLIERESRVKLAWLKEKHGVDVKLLRWDKTHGWQQISLSGRQIAEAE